MRLQAIRSCLSSSSELSLIPSIPHQIFQAWESRRCLFAFSSLDPCMQMVCTATRRHFSPYKVWIHRSHEISYSPFIGFECSQPSSLYYGDCSEQHPSYQREFRDCLWQLLVIAPVLRLFSHFVLGSL